ncbi:hypothetical protein B0H17DRAFT_1125763 [Mycena rosella]|uniref:Uncharacterized protein n=1 Tax=Mycena rosella TaxID=1033263 RepID=A0AAD7GWV0_MYCRO|nr:hypothetical protein B0H17DRAFT_1125763 [Mycena rosella]
MQPPFKPVSRLKEACSQEYIPAVEQKLATKPPKLNSVEAFKVQEFKHMVLLLLSPSQYLTLNAFTSQILRALWTSSSIVQIVSAKWTPSHIFVACSWKIVSIDNPDHNRPLTGFQGLGCYDEIIGTLGIIVIGGRADKIVPSVLSLSDLVEMKGLYEVGGSTQSFSLYLFYMDQDDLTPGATAASHTAAPLHSAPTVKVEVGSDTNRGAPLHLVDQPDVPDKGVCKGICYSHSPSNEGKQFTAGDSVGLAGMTPGTWTLQSGMKSGDVMPTQHFINCTVWR